MSTLIRIDLLDPSPWADLFDHPADHIAALAEDIAARGIQTPVQVFPLGNGRYELLTGHDRVEAARGLGMKEVPCELRSMLLDEDARFRHFIADNTQRKDVNRRVLIVAVLKRAEGNISDREVARLVRCSHTTVADVRLELEATGQIGQLEKTVGHDGKERPRPPREPRLRTNGPKPTRPPGPRLKLPAGETPESVVRRGMEVEREQGGGDETAAAAVGMSTDSFSRIKRVILLADDEHLKPEASLRARQALDAINNGAAVTTAFESVRDIVEAKFGSGHGGGPAAARFALRLAALERAVLGICSACAALDVVEVPAGIPADKREEWLNDLAEAEKSIRQLKTRVKEA